MFRSMWQEVADVLEAVVLEKALQLRARYSSWLEVAKAIHAAAPSSWPKTLGDSAAFNVSLEISPLNSRLKAKFRPEDRKRTVAAARKKHTNARRCVDTAKHLSAAAAKQDL